MKFHLIKLLLVVTLTLGLSSAVALTTLAATSPVAVDYQSMDKFISHQMEKHRIPGVAFAVFEGGKVTYAKGFGSAGKGRPITPDTPMIIGSTTKSFTAVAVLQLAEQGRIHLDAPVRTYLPWFRVADASASNTITVRHLLNHTSGLSELGYNRVLNPDISLEQAVRDLRLARLTAPVGTRFQYFNSNYAALALIIQTVSGQTYGNYVTQHIFAPLQMNNSYAHRKDTADVGLAQGHSKLFGFAVGRKPVFRSYLQGAGYLVSTANDLARFMMAIDNGGEYNGTRILTPASVALMVSPPAHISGATYAMGWATGSHQGEITSGHSGADEIFTSLPTLLPNLHKGYVLLMNQQHIIDDIVVSSQINTGMLDIMLGRKPNTGGISMRVIGFIFLGIFLVATVATVRSFIKLQGWVNRSRDLSIRQVVWQITPHFVVPGIILVVLYRYLGVLFLGEPRAWNFASVGAYYLPDVALLMLLAIVPDLVQGGYKIVSLAIDRRINAQVKQ